MCVDCGEVPEYWQNAWKVSVHKDMGKKNES